MNRIKAIDETLFWWVNGHHNIVADWSLWTASQKWSWAIVIVAVAFFIVFFDRFSAKPGERYQVEGTTGQSVISLKRRVYNTLWLLAGVALCFLLADQISNNAIKEGVQRLRPCYGLEDVRMFRTGKGGLYGFPSSHAANAFAITMFFMLVYRNITTRKSHWFPIVMLFWAIVVAYSRVYLGKHYPLDVICGSLLGIGVGAAVYFAISRIRLFISSRREA